MKVLITGGAGFIGSHLSERLLAEGHQVSVLDDLSTGSVHNIEHLTQQPAFEHRVGSVTDAALVDEMVDQAEATIHLAAAVGVRLIVERPVHTIETNVQGTQIVLEAAARNKQLFFLASTSEVYGKRASVPFREDDDLVLGPTTHSRWAYACSKALDEWLTLAFARERDLPVIVGRFFNTVGPRQTGRYGMVLPSFARQAVRGEPITVYGSGEQSRCFAHVGDVVEAVSRLFFTESARGKVFNIGTDHEITIRRLAEMVRDAAGTDSPIVQVPYEEAYGEGFEDMMRRVPAVDRLEAAIGFRPTTATERIVEEVVAEQRQILSAAGE